jgi:hypothetical protein
MSRTDQSSPIDANAAGTGGDQWPTHEHLAETALLQAQKLVEELGSVGLAKHAVEAVGEAMTAMTSEPRQSGLAKALKFESYALLLAASSAVPSNDGNHWYLTSLSDGTWAAWNDSSLEAERHYSSLDEALANVPHDEQCSGSSLLG